MKHTVKLLALLAAPADIDQILHVIEAGINYKLGGYAGYEPLK